ncbi:RNA methyltransferase [Granulicella sp. 5B5]|uniref:RNA methyltransferase n=1 Tax=Granulicella sp. 5B5 TaxID=1617967 RepID=UPI0015F77A66|nr:RNA methyltransferase [Granulicella sp. 5B5]QMV18698.1 RNA methyltransferase [Granulicella sp. 5B5]
MLTSDARAQLTVVLVGARNPSNIGAAARAIYDFGFSDLRVVNEYAAPFEAAQLEDQSAGLPEVKSAVRASSVMQRARRFDALAEAIADCQLVVGTTAIGAREMRQKIEPIRETAPRVREALDGGLRVALLFGSEKTGLTNDQLSHCSVLTTVPMYQPEGERHLSMNLGQSVAVCLYELSREGFDGMRELPVLHEAAATVEDRERLTQLLLDAMHVTGYTRRYPHNAHEPLVRQLVQQLGTSHREAMTWMGFLRQVLRREQGETQ